MPSLPSSKCSSPPTENQCPLPPTGHLSLVDHFLPLTTDFSHCFLSLITNTGHLLLASTTLAFLSSCWRWIPGIFPPFDNQHWTYFPPPHHWHKTFYSPWPSVLNIADIALHVGDLSRDSRWSKAITGPTLLLLGWRLHIPEFLSTILDKCSRE